MNITVIESSEQNSGVLKVNVQNNEPVTLPMGTSFLFRLRSAPFPKVKYLEEKRNIFVFTLIFLFLIIIIICPKKKFKKKIKINNLMILKK